MSSEEKLARRRQIEGLVENSLGVHLSLCDDSPAIHKIMASSQPLAVIRGSEERRIIDNIATIGHALRKEVYHWSLTSGLNRCLPTADNYQSDAPEPITLSEEGKRKVPAPGLPMLLWYLLNEWQHPFRGSDPTKNPTYAMNRTDITASDSKGVVFILKDAHMLLNPQSSAIAIRMLKDLVEAIAWQISSRNGQNDMSLFDMTIIITAPIGWEIPVEFRDLASDLIFPRPNNDEFSSLLYEAALIDRADSTNAKYRQMAAQEGQILHAATGLSASNFLGAIKESCVEQALDRNDPYNIRHDIIADAKKNAIKAGGAIIYEEPNWSMSDVGGHDVLKSYLQECSLFFDPTNPIQDQLPEGVHLPMPKGILMVGIPGCGKSLEAKAMASMLNVPLLTLDMGAVFTGIVGGSEQRVREAIQLAEDCAPCVMRIEEIEKALSGSGSSNMSDGGTTNRVFQTVLNWLQEKEKAVFVVATANDVAQLPPELLRKGRFDEIFFVDLPVLEERVDILRIHLRKSAGLTDEQIDTQFDLIELARKTDKFSGAEIEALVKRALLSAVFSHRNDGTLADFSFNNQHIYDTIGPDGSRTFKILADSEVEKLNNLRNIARSSWMSASSYEFDATDRPAAKKSPAATSAFFTEDVPSKPVVRRKKAGPNDASSK